MEHSDHHDVVVGCMEEECVGETVNENATKSSFDNGAGIGLVARVSDGVLNATPEVICESW